MLKFLNKDSYLHYNLANVPARGVAFHYAVTCLFTEVKVLPSIGLQQQNATHR